MSMYGGALAASLQRDHAAAERLAGQALALAQQAEPREPQTEREVRLLQAQLRLARGDAAAALQALDAIDIDGKGRAPLLYRAQAVLGLNRQAGNTPATL